MSPRGVEDKYGNDIVKRRDWLSLDCQPLVHIPRKEDLQVMKKDWAYRRGDIYMADLSPVCGSEQGGVRPVVVIQNNIGNHHSPTLIVATITTKTRKKTKQPTHYLMRDNPALAHPSVVLLEQIRTIDKQRVERYLGKATRKEMFGINAALLISLALSPFSRQ